MESNLATPMARLFRFWMTGCLAVVAAAMTGRGAIAEERAATSIRSRYDVAETIERIEERAHERGLSVFARLPSGTSRLRNSKAEEGAVIVFESQQGGTPVLMETADAAPDLPLALWIRRNAAGEVEVVIHRGEWDGLPADVARDMTQMPQLVDEALG
jgi:uncharacterized protein (DUF302 family)